MRLLKWFSTTVYLSEAINEFYDVIFNHSLSVLSTIDVRSMIRQSDIEGLEQVILDGHGQKLLGENAADNKIRAFIKAVPSYLVNSIFSLFLAINNQHDILLLQRKIEKIHETVVKGDLDALQNLITRRKLALSKDDNGLGLLHKAVYHGHREIAEWLLEKYPECLEVKDWVSYLAASKNFCFDCFPA